MDYFTEYNLTVRKVKNIEMFEELCKVLKEKDIINCALSEGTYNPKTKEAYFYSFDSVKWYNHAEHMVYVAEKFPKMYFMLEGSGEESGDFWREYYHDMDIEYCHGDIIYEEPKKVQWTELIPF